VYKTPNSAFNWTGRVAYCLSGIYFLVAVLQTRREKYSANLGASANWAEAFRGDKQQLETLFSKMLNAFAFHQIVTKEGKPVDYVYLAVNDAFEKMTGLKREKVIGKPVTEILPGIERESADWIGVFGKVALTGEPTMFENYSNSIRRWYSVSSYSPKKGYFVAIFEDITERKNAEEKLEEYSRNLERLVEERTNQLKDSERLAAIGATAGMVGHDIRNPLQAITSDLYLAKTELENLGDGEEKKNALESLGEIEKNVDYINKIVQDLQDYARPLNPKAELIDLEAVVGKLVEKNSIPQNVKVTVKISKDTREIQADAYYLNRILTNLVTNSVQAMPDGGKLTIKAEKQADDVVLSVQDTGHGIPEGIQSKMFTVMFTTKSKGQGFGLPVVKRMTESLGGSVAFVSQEGKGTTFTIRLPAQKK